MVQPPAIVNCSLPKNCDWKLLAERVRKESLNLPRVTNTPTTSACETCERRRTKQSLIRTSSFTRFTGAGGWSISDAWKIQRFFSDTFSKQLPIAVFGQGAIHDRWRLDHHNAMDIQLHPDGVEGEALLNFLQKNGIPYSAFRSAIPGTATGPHIHIGRPSHRY